MEPIPLDVNRVGCPEDVIHSIVADMIRDHYNAVHLEPPATLTQFLESQPQGRGYDWQERLFQALLDQPIELMEEWVEKGAPAGFFRAELRGILNKRKVS